MTTKPLFAVLAGLVLVSTLALTATLRFPEVLLDPPSFAEAQVRGGFLHLAAIVVSLLALAASGIVLLVVSKGARLGAAAAACWIAGAGIGLALVPVWATGTEGSVSGALSWIAFVATAIAAPLLLAGWTVAVSRDSRVLGTLGAFGLLVIAARSAAWLVNTLLPPDEGFYLTSAVLTTLTLIAFPLWLVWLVRMATRRVIAALAAPALVIAYVAATFAGTPAPHGEGAPAVPSAAGSAFYTLMTAIPSLIPLPQNLAELRAERKAELAKPIELPPGATMDKLDANGVPTERICADNASAERLVVYLPGGGFTSIAGNGPRRFAAAISRGTKACVLLTHYRLAPEHPYPAGRQDAVTVYRWLRDQGHENLVVIGDSAGGNLTLTSALALRDSGDPLPAALVSVSGVTDLSLTGKTFTTLADRDPLLSRGQRKLVFDSYTRNGTIDLHDPLLSPLYADTRSLPPTLLMVGTQEVLLGDVLAMGDRMRADGVDLDLQAWPGMPHAWPLVAEEAPESRMAIAQIVAFIERSWSTVR